MAALSCVVRAFSKQHDLSMICGRLWYEAANMQMQYVARYVESKLNLADGPSRNDISSLVELGATECFDWHFPSFTGGFGDWIASPCQAHRALKF